MTMLDRMREAELFYDSSVPDAIKATIRAGSAEEAVARMHEAGARFMHDMAVNQVACIRARRAAGWPVEAQISDLHLYLRTWRERRREAKRLRSTMLRKQLQASVSALAAE